MIPASKQEREAAKAAEKAAKEAVKLRKATIKTVKAEYKEYARLLRSKDLAELKSGLVHCSNNDFMTIGGGLVALVKASKSKVGTRRFDAAGWQVSSFACLSISGS